jgi:hypothetical protein
MMPIYDVSNGKPQMPLTYFNNSKGRGHKDLKSYIIEANKKWPLDYYAPHPKGGGLTFSLIENRNRH